MANEADRAFLSKRVFESINPCLITIEFTKTLRDELLQTPAGSLAVPLANPRGSIPASGFLVLHATVSLPSGYSRRRLLVVVPDESVSTRASMRHGKQRRSSFRVGTVARRGATGDTPKRSTLAVVDLRQQ